MFRTNRFITFKIGHRKHFSMLFFSYPWPKCTPSCNYLNNGDKLTITSSVIRTSIYVLAFHVSDIICKYIRLKSVFVTSTLLNGIMVGDFFEKNIKKALMLHVHHDKNYCYFCKSNIPVINLIVGSRKMIKVSKNMSL